MSSEEVHQRQGRRLLVLSLVTFFLLLGARSLNEPDEGRYAEVAREMLECGDWLVPHIWYVPHLDKPPLTYWAVAASMSLFGQNEWAVRLPLALAGLSGVWAVFLLGRAMGGWRAGLWSALLLQSSVLYFVMARMLTPDLLVTQFICWACYFGWRSWRSLDVFGIADERARVRAGRQCFLWQQAAWAAMGLGFLTKGPVAVVVPLAALAALAIFGRRETVRWQLCLLGLLPGLLGFAIIIGPWFGLVFQTVPRSLEYMVFGQALGHALGTAIKNRGGPPFYFVGILAVGFLPWTPLLGWLWRRNHWRGLRREQKEGWLFLTAWAGFTFLLFSLVRAKLPAYILPLWPALAILVALRWFRSDSPSPELGAATWGWRAVMVSPLAILAAVALCVRLVFGVTDAPWTWPLVGVAGAGLAILLVIGRNWVPTRCAHLAVGLALLSLMGIVALVPTVETSFKANQTLKPLALALKREYRPGDVLICCGQLPQGLPFYAFPIINARSRPYLADLALDQLPFEFPGNRARFGSLVLPDDPALKELLTGDRRVLVVGFQGAFRKARGQCPTVRWITQVGRWELFANH